MKLNPLDNPRLRDEESLFSRDLDGHLVRLDKATAENLDQDVTVVIDGRVIRVKRALHAVDSQGLPRYDERGRAIPRPTTILDAAKALTEAVPIAGPGGRPLTDADGRVIHRPRTDADPLRVPEANPIPTLCHLPHQEPVGVCRVCVVEISKVKRGERRTERKLLPACQHRVEDAMEVRTIATSKKIETAVKTVVELLLADHPRPCAKRARAVESDGEDCELEALADRLGLGAPRFECRPPRPIDDSSLLIAVDHNACILCDRCVRGCDDVKDNQVIGRMRKGYAARIAFDLDAPMGKSTCVSCGECMVSCPTGALVFRHAIDRETFEGETPAEKVRPADLLGHAHPEIRRAFADVSPTFLEWNATAIVRRRFDPGQLICKQGEYGSTAFFIEGGEAEIFIKASPREADARAKGGFLGLFRRRRGAAVPTEGAASSRRFIPADAPLVLSADRPQATLDEGDLFGEMACLNAYPRAATVRAGARGCTVLEMQRNVLDIIRRSRSYREEMNRKVRERIIKVVLANVPLLSGIEETFLDELSKSATYRRCEPGEEVIRQGDLAAGGDEGNKDHEGLFLIRSGFVKIARARPGGQEVLSYRGPGTYIGEVGLLALLDPDDFGPLGAELAADVAEIRRLVGPGRRIATCTAIDHVELVRIAPEDFRRLLKTATPRALRSVVAEALARLRQTFSGPLVPTAEASPGAGPDPEASLVRGAALSAFLDQGLFGAQSLLVLDLEKCTRCDECTRACSDTHGNVSRLIREGLRFDKYLVASSCRSCHDPVCMIGCPVDAIHRRPGSNEIWIEDHCIGCGKCAENCPYGNINMHELDGGRDADAPTAVAVARKATTCDQCRSLPGHAPNCVVACPHDAAHRMPGQQLFALVEQAGRF